MHSSLHFQTRIKRSIPTDGALIQPGDRNAGRWSRNGYGTSAWNWDINSSQSRCAPPSSLLLSALLKQGRRLRRATSLLPLEEPGKPDATREKILCSLQMEPWVAKPGKKLFPQERRLERSGSLRIVYEARIADCRACEQRPHCQWHGQENQHPRRVSVLLHPRKSGSAPVLWRDWPRRTQRRACMQVLHRQRVEVTELAAAQPPPPALSSMLTRSQRARYRWSWNERFARNARGPTSSQLLITLFGVPEVFAAFLGL